MRRHVLWGLPGVAGLGMVIWQLTPIRGVMGHDFYHYFARLYVGAAHFWQNGWSVPHYTAALCGGLPVFADPQSMYYSVPQWLTFGMDPVGAILLTHVLFYALGYFGFYRLLRDGFSAGPALAHWGSLAFLLNGFSFEHLLVGHMTHHSYLLFPWGLYLVVVSRLPVARRAGLLSLLVLYTFYSGGTHVIVVLAAAGLCLLPWAVDRAVRENRLAEIASVLLITAVLVAAGAAPKLAAAASLSPSFLARPIDSSRLAIPTLLLRFLWPDPSTIPDTIPFGKWHFGPWEYVGFVSKLFIPTIPAWLLFVVFRPVARRLAVALATVFAVYVVAWVGAAKHAEHGLPLLQSYHNPIKVYGAFIPLLVLATVALIRRLDGVPRFRATTPWVQWTLFGVATFTMLFEFGFQSTYFVHNKLVYGFRYDPETYAALKTARRLPPVIKVTEEYGRDVDGIAYGATSTKCFEPMFGYRREVMKAALTAGPVDQTRGNRFNLTHPGCLVYPEFFGCNRWDRIPKSDEAAFRKFTHGDTAAWGVPLWQTGLLRLGLAALLTALALSSGAASLFRRHREVTAG